MVSSPLRFMMDFVIYVMSSHYVLIYENEPFRRIMSIMYVCMCQFFFPVRKIRVPVLRDVGYSCEFAVRSERENI